VDLYILDECLFNDNIEGAIIADSLVHAQGIFRKTIKFAYDRLPQTIRNARPLTTESRSELSFSNGSVVSVGVTMRSGTPQLLHISEFGRICVRAPDKAREIVTGSLQSVEISGNQIIWIESTAAGRAGYFFDFCERARKVKKKDLTKLDFKFFFFPWYKHPGHVLRNAKINMTPKQRAYFAKLENKHNIKLSIERKCWYAKQENILGPDMKPEHPSHPDEAFEVSQEGQYWREQLTKLRHEGRIGDVSIAEGIPIDTAWDIGVDDYTVIWFLQTIGEQIHIVDFFENKDYGLEYYVEIIKGKGYKYGRHYAPHDMAAREWGGGKSRLEQALAMGLSFKVVPRVDQKADSIEAVRRILQYCWFDEEKCEPGLEHLEAYRKEWDSVNGMWRAKPLHDIHSNAADAFQCLAMSHNFSPNKLQLNRGSIDEWAI
jgi:hypothetical protein